MSDTEYTELEFIEYGKLIPDEVEELRGIYGTYIRAQDGHFRLNDTWQRANGYLPSNTAKAGGPNGVFRWFPHEFPLLITKVGSPI